MKIAISGYGKMGHEIELIALDRGHEIIVTIDDPAGWMKEKEILPQADVAIDFSTPETVMDNIRHCFDLNVPIVVGTTGWHRLLEEIQHECLTRKQSLFFAPNFSIGVNLFFELNRCLATLMSNWPDYEISLEETHHIHKQDSPSGTAIVLADDIIQYLGRKKGWVKDKSTDPEDIGIRSFRLEDVTGTHKVIYDSPIDTIEIQHSAKSRKGFALGAVLAAEWLPGNTGFFGMKDLFQAIKNKEDR